MLDSLRSLGTRGSKLIRLDAFGYATKTPGTRCFFQVSCPAASMHVCKLVCAHECTEEVCFIDAMHQQSLSLLNL